VGSPFIVPHPLFFLLWAWEMNFGKRSVGMFYRQRILVIDGKYNNNDGLSTGRICQVGTRSILGRCNRASSIRSKEIVQRCLEIDGKQAWKTL
jgi:hypothetical protein